MLLLLLFALVAGAGTAITPCVLPVLPALLSASAVGGRRRPLGIVLGLALTFTITIVALAQLVNGVGLGSSATRIAGVRRADRLRADHAGAGARRSVSRHRSHGSRASGPKTRGDGFWTGLGVGAALGFVCAPCAGPILAAVIAVSASRRADACASRRSASRTRSVCPRCCSLYAFGGRAVLDRIRRAARGEIVERVLGVVLLAPASRCLQPRRPLREPARPSTGTRACRLPDRSDRVARELVGGVQNKLASLRPDLEVRQAPSGG